MVGGRSDTRTRSELEFVAEVEEILDRMRDACAQLAEPSEASDGDPEAIDPEIVNGLFRSAHTLKGIAGLFGFDAASELAHATEDLLDDLRHGRRPFDAALRGVLDAVLAAFASMLEAVGRHDFTVAARSAVDAVLPLLAAVPPAGAGRLAALEIEPDLLRTLTDYEEHRLSEGLRAGRSVAIVEAVFTLDEFEQGLERLGESIRAHGEVVSTLPSSGGSAERLRFALLCTLRIAPEALAEHLREAHALHPIGGVPSVRALALSSAAASPPLRTAKTEETAFPSLRSISGTVRVDIRKLDELMTMVGELSLQRAAIERMAEELSTAPETEAAGARLAKVNHDLERRMRDLQNGVLEARMVPLRQVFEKLSRVIHRLRHGDGKQVAIEFAGAETELDKLIVEELVDPLMHLVRNAFDHAIESPEERVRAGKPEAGMVRVVAMQRGNHVAIEVSDDGRGIDPESVHRRAIELGLVGAEQALGAREVLDLVFEPGFTMRDGVGATSGRGVGMDVVRSNMTALGGVVELQSEPGSGTRVTLTLPITLALMQALLVRVDGERFAIPLSAVVETLLIQAAEVQRSEGHSLIDLRGEALLLGRLSELLDSTSSRAQWRANEKLYVVVLGLGDLRLGLIVDELEGQQDAVIKPIQGPMRDIRGIAGATELGDGAAVLVLDVAGLVDRAQRSREAA